MTLPRQLKRSVSSASRPLSPAGCRKRLALLSVVAILVALASGCLGSSSASTPRPTAAALTRQIEARRLRAVGWSLQDVHCLIPSHDSAVSCRAILREAGDSQIASVVHVPIQVRFHLNAAGQLGSPICVSAVMHDNPFCLLVSPSSSSL
jgi:hypothetical protein